MSRFEGRDGPVRLFQQGRFPVFARVRDRFPGVIIAGLAAASAEFLSEHYGAPAMLMAILIGLSLGFLAEEPRTAPGVAFASRGLLRIGVALLGLRVSAAMLAALGLPTVLMVIGSTFATIGVSILLAPLFGKSRTFGFLTGGAVAICGASAALALGALLAPGRRAERDIAFTVVTVTLLSTIAMIAYPILASWVVLNDQQAGVFLGATIHDVAQVVGAGFSVSDSAGEIATLVKLLRVTLLAPIVLGAAIFLRRVGPSCGKRPPILPAFVAFFLVFATMNSLGLVPDQLRELSSDISRWFLLTAVAAVGMKTSIAQLVGLGVRAISLVVLETLFLGVLVLGALLILLS